MFLARVYVTLKPSVNDPQGLTIQGGLHMLGFKTVQHVRMGKFLELELDEATEAEAKARIEEMCNKLLANPVIEDYRYDLEPVA